MDAKDAMIESVIEYERRLANAQTVIARQAALIDCYERQANEYAQFVKLLKDLLESKNMT